MRKKIILKLISIMMLVSLASVGFAAWTITAPTVESTSNGNVDVDKVIEIDALTCTTSADGLRYNKKGFFTQYTYQTNSSDFEQKTYDNFTYYVNVDLPMVEDKTAYGTVELRIELKCNAVDIETISDKIVITSTTGHKFTEPVVKDGKLCLYIEFDITEESKVEKVGINFNLAKIDTKPEQGEEPEEAFFIALSNLSEVEEFEVIASLYSKTKE